ncbi:bile acid:sodium symporter family protein [Mesobacillus harenae]|uniref:bile acid:sodium symporter family protein n=1 Tax=Mesobacillus harenae TaxID=2213203 RepID=UPI001F54E3AD|nr:bile acid:sodium symporter family protein [Mesobacillus harenae]
MLYRINKRLEKIMPIITPASVIIGVLLAEHLSGYAYLIPWLFAFMTFSGSISSNFNSLTQTIYHPKPLFLVFFILHIVMPLLAWGTGLVAFPGDTYTITGLVLAMAIPTGISSFIWVSIYRGHIPLTLSIILIDTFLSPLIVPFTLSILLQTSVEIEVMSMMKGLVLMIVIPSFLGMLLNQVTKGKCKEVLSPRLAPFSKLGLAVVVMINASVVAPYLRNVDLKLIGIALTVLGVAFMGYMLSFLSANFFKNDRETVIALTFTGGMRNISAGAVIAVTYFPAAVAVPVVIGMLFQQVLASVYGVILSRHYKKSVRAKSLNEKVG